VVAVAAAEVVEAPGSRRTATEGRVRLGLAGPTCAVHAAAGEHTMAERPDYREIEHTADVGLELEAPDLKAAFELAAASMFDLMCDLDGVGGDVCRTVRIRARDADLENMMVRWLSELLYVFESEGLLLSRFDVRKLTSDALEADVAGERFNPDHHAVKLEIKAVTYHDMAVNQVEGVWHVRVIFDT
jgi:SHS2 domain-containing protein